ncbi:hypothetical protein SBA4_910028 [Candidatus Sulfopaludibacter sp. SbA4]|nr:hypothetical protein SBA4_910028 [Candidatus Sulfopaludibacter sp. SbA4]
MWDRPPRLSLFLAVIVSQCYPVLSTSLTLTDNPKENLDPRLPSSRRSTYHESKRDEAPRYRPRHRHQPYSRRAAGGPEHQL